MPPSFDEVTQLPESHSVVVPEAWGDENGHMSMPYYLLTHDGASRRFFYALGFDEPYVASEQRGFFDVEQHTLYLREALVGDRLSGHVRLLERSEKAVHHMSFIVNHRTGEVSNVLESMSLHVDLRSRRTAPLFPQEAQWLDGTLEAHQALDWAPAPSGSIGIRRPAA